MAIANTATITACFSLLLIRVSSVVCFGRTGGESPRHDEGIVIAQPCRPLAAR
jgi:hypothetical protein